MKTYKHLEVREVPAEPSGTGEESGTVSVCDRPYVQRYSVW